MVFDALRETEGVHQGLASSSMASLHVSVSEEERPVALTAQLVYGDFFRVLDVRPAVGRLLSTEDNQLGGDPLVGVIGGELRDALFGPGADPTGRTLRVTGHTVRVLGVAGGGFTGPERDDRVELWLPFTALIPVLRSCNDYPKIRRDKSEAARLILVADDRRSAAAELDLTGVFP